MSSEATRAPFFMIDQAILTEYDLNPYEYTLYSAIVSHVNHESGLAWPSYSRLMEVARIARGTVSKYLKTLEAKGLIEITRRFKPGSKERANNQYRLLHPHRPADDAGSSQSDTEVVHGTAQGSSSPNTTVVHAVDGNQTLPEQNQLTRSKSNQRETARAPKTQRSKRSKTRQPVALPQNMTPEERFDWGFFCHQLANVCQLDIRIDENLDDIHRAAVVLWRDGTGYTVEDLKTFETWWYASDWRGKKGDVPRLKEVLKEIRKAVNASDRAAKASEADRYQYINGKYAAFIDH